MRQTAYYKQDIPELGDPSNITVVSNAIADGEVNQSGKIEYMNATNSGNEISLKSNSRMANNASYYNGMGFIFKTPIALNKSDTTYTLKVDNLTAQPFKVKMQAVVGDVITVFYDTPNGFVFTNSPIPKSSAINSNSEETLATSKAVKTLNDNKTDKGGYTGTAQDLKNAIDKKANNTITITAGNGLDGGGDLSANRTINVVSKNDGIIVNPNDIQLNIYDGVDGTSTTRPASAGAVKKAYDKSVEAENSISNKLDRGGYKGTAQDLKNAIDGKLDKGNITSDWDSAEKIKNNWYKIIPNNIGKGPNITVDLNDIVENGIYVSNNFHDQFTHTPEGVVSEFELICIGITLDTPFYKTQILTKAGKSEMFIRTCTSYQAPWVWTEWSTILHTNQQINELKTSSKKLIDAINECLWRKTPNIIGNINTSINILSVNQSGSYISKDYNNKWDGLPNDFDSRGAFYLDVTSFTEGQDRWRKYTLRSMDSSKIWELTTNNAGTIVYGWYQIITNRSLFYLGAIGLGNEIKYIQDNITKEVDKGYIDKTTGRPYRCINQAPASITTPNAEYFEPADNISISSNNSSESKWREVTSSRTPNTDYTNNNSYPIHVSVSWLTSTNGTNGGYLTVDGVVTACEANQGVDGLRAGVWTVVPPGGVYRFIGPTPSVWSELY